MLYVNLTVTIKQKPIVDTRKIKNKSKPLSQKSLNCKEDRNKGAKKYKTDKMAIISP